jgi:hypothetical protein
VAVGRGGTVLLTEDGGATWIDHRSKYARYPAPWLYGAWILGAFAAFVLVRRGDRHIDEESIGADLKADQPAASVADDRLGFDVVVRALANFLRNVDTKPPLVLAINGDWGTGKSSLMGMLSDSMRKWGVRPVWFNAWHHQEDKLLTVPFLESVSVQSLPPLASFLGVRFRLRLAVRRIGRRWALSSFFILSFAGSILAIGHDPPGFAAAAREALAVAEEPVKSLKKKLDFLANRTHFEIPVHSDNPPGPTAPVTEQRPEPREWLLAAMPFLALALVVGIVLMLDAFLAFPVMPGVLMAMAADRFKLRDAHLQAAYRRRYMRWFEDVAWALRPRPILIFVDNLDRCKHCKAMQVLEAVNFLVNCGECFVVLGIAKHRVERLVGLASEELAEEMADASADDSTAAKRERRRSYASEYLEKLIQIDIPVPRKEAAALIRLIEAETPAADGEIGRDEWRSRWGDAIARLAPWRDTALLSMGIVGVVSVGLAVAGVVQYFSPPPTRIEVASTADAESPRPTTAPIPAEGTTAPRRAPTPADEPPAIVVHERETSLWPIGVLAGALGALVLSLLVTRVPYTIRDSRAYNNAVRRWQSVIVARRPTPRSVRRFGNRTRYFAMMLRPEREASRLARRQAEDHDIDRTAVALSAIHHARPDLLAGDAPILEPKWADALERIASVEVQKPDQSTKVLDDIHEALSAETSEGMTWPPKREIVDRYMAYVAESVEIEREQAPDGPGAQDGDERQAAN